jgi:ABC-2 type transport system permease protein
VLVAGAMLALVGQALVIGGVALALPSTDYASWSRLAALCACWQHRCSRELSVPSSAPGLGAVIRNIGGAVTTAVLVLFVIPPLAVQLISGTASWILPALFAVITGVSTEVSLWAALLSVAAWALIPAAAGLVAVQRRDVA